MGKFSEKLLCEYEKKREIAKQKADQAFAKAHLDLPNLGKLEAMRREAAIEHMINASRGVSSDHSVKELTEQIASELAQIGMSEADFSPHYECKLCNDKGYTPDNKACKCLMNRLLELELESSGFISDGFEQFDFSLFESDPYRLNFMKSLKEYCQEYAEQFPNTQKQNLIFFGETGLGKTFMLGSIAKRVITGGSSVLFVSAYSLFSEILSAIKANENPIKQYVSVDLLAIDDLGSEPLIRNITMEYLFLILNERAKKHTLIATNLDDVQLRERYGERVFSRIFDSSKSEWFKLFGDDLRTMR